MNATDEWTTVPGGHAAADVCCPLHANAGRLRAGVAPDDCLRCPRCGRPYDVIDGIPDAVSPRPEDAEYLVDESRQWDRHAPVYDGRRVRDERYSAAIAAAVEALRPRQGESVLDAACGTGLTVRRYAGRGVRVIAMDLSMRSLGLLRRSLDDRDVTCVRGDLTALPFATASFDAVVCANAIQQVPGDDRRRRCLRELVRVVRPGGRVVVTAHQHSLPRRRAEWCKEGPAGSLSGDVRYVYRFGHAEFRDWLAAELDVETVHGAGFPLPYRWKLSPVSRAAERRLWRFGGLAPWADMLVGMGRKRA